ncbi:hypothetical protein IE81DRAFT_342945 [Ceraceosorus guamensis]|uniref:SERRATE/Ars2 N-terminal domain-containing protein n=1 Tax=Ceraceosorus guamensis TaxID=1522189 RepID=A0A316VSQ1_9BASI|nr:hypothetical protein IE81DRAFT_342945 [Ceraceosorus guamensis]PWN40068.1 hypothetical protein IE81DRAFT_342945 [Ceraceosorus guamensis]
MEYRPDYSHDPYESERTHYHGDPRPLKRRLSPVHPFSGADTHTAAARGHSPWGQEGGEEVVNGFRIDPTRKDPEYLDWIDRQRAKERAAAAASPYDRYPLRGDDRERLDWERERDTREWERTRDLYDDQYRFDPRVGGDGERYAPKARVDDEWDRTLRFHDPYAAGYGGRGSAAGSGPREPVRFDPFAFDYLLPFKRFAQMLREAADPIAASNTPQASAELYEKYQKYRTDFQRKAMQRFFKEHNKDFWFEERYGLAVVDVQRRLDRRRKGREGRKERWLGELRSGSLDKVDFELKPASSRALEGIPGTLEENEKKGWLMSTSRLGQEEVLLDTEQASTPAQPNEVLLRVIPHDLPRTLLEEVLQEQVGFRYLAVGEPHPGKKWGRMGWAVFEPESDLHAITEALNAKTINGIKLAFETTDRAPHARLRIAPAQASSLARLAHDLRQARELVSFLQKQDRELERRRAEDAEDQATGAAQEWLDTDASVEIDARCEAIGKGLQGRSAHDIQEDAKAQEVHDDEEASKPLRDALCKHLDLHLDLLRQVYHCDYYASIICDFAEELVRRSPKHLRRTRAVSTQVEKGWGEALDSKHWLLVNPDKANLESYGGHDVPEELLKLAAPYSQQDEGEKHRCVVPITGPDGGTQQCSKPFKAANFVRKHVVNKHRAFLDDFAGEKIKEMEAFNSYVGDPGRVMPALQARDDRGRTGRGHARGDLGGSGQLAQRLGGILGGFEDSFPSHAPAGIHGGPLIRLGGSTMASADVGGRAIRGFPRRSESYVDERYANGALAFSNGAVGDLSSRLGPPMPQPSKPNSSPPTGTFPAPLPPAPKPLDPRARRAPNKYEDLDSAPGGAAEEAGELILEY